RGPAVCIGLRDAALPGRAGQLPGRADRPAQSVHSRAGASRYAPCAADLDGPTVQSAGRRMVAGWAARGGEADRCLSPELTEGRCTMTERTMATGQKALVISLDPTSYGTFAETGGGQEVIPTCRWV